MIRPSITITLAQQLASGPFLFCNDLQGCCRIAAELGFDAIEILPPSANDLPIEELRTLLDSFGLNLAGVGMGAAAMQGHGREEAFANMFGGAIGVVSAIIAIVMSVIILMGALKMKKLESWGLVLAAAIVAMLPCLSCGCLVGLVAGIWSLVVLNDPSVKAAFK